MVFTSLLALAVAAEYPLQAVLISVGTALVLLSATLPFPLGS
jgi:hypothetical protein